MEVLRLDIVGSYSYKPDLEIKTYGEDGNGVCDYQITTQCVICKRGLEEPSEEQISNVTNMSVSNEILIGRCGHIFHADCMCKWLETTDCCPIDKVKWCLHHVADTTCANTLVMCEPEKRWGKRKWVTNNRSYRYPNKK